MSAVNSLIVRKMSNFKIFSEVHQITKNLYLTAGIAVTESNLEKYGINLVINATRDLPICPFGTDIKVVRIPVADRPTEDIYRYYEEACRIIHECAQRGQNVLVHCVAGVSRSASICMAYLIKYKGMSLMQAYNHVKKKRPCVRPNQGFVSQLVDWEWTVHGHKLLYEEEIIGNLERAIYGTI